MKEHVWAILSFFVLGFALLYFFQRTFIYAPAKYKPSLEAFHASYMTEITLHTSDNLELSAWYKPADKGKPSIIVFHGNARNIGARAPLARAHNKLGFGVLLLEYRGYGQNPGRPSENGLYRDARAGITFLKERGVPINHIVLYGESLGTGVATQMAVEYPNACALILQSPYTSLSALRRYHFPWLPITPWDKFDSLARIQKIHMPLLALHGTEDLVVPYNQGKRLFDRANAPKQWVKLLHQGHGGLWSPDFINATEAFIQKYCE